MNNLDATISYNWKWSWKISGKPVVNRLMKAIIEQNIQEMYSLVQKGAHIEALEEYTLGRILYINIKSFDIFKFFIDNGCRGYWDDKKSSLLNNVLNENFYNSSPMSMAYYREAYDVFELLIKNGYGNDYLTDRNNECINFLKLIMERQDINAIKILMDHGFNRNEILERGYYDKYIGTPCYEFLRQNIPYHRKSFVINTKLMYTIPQPELEKPRLFNRKKVENKNKALIDDYQDMLRVQKEFMDSLSPEQRQYVLERPKRDKIFLDAMRNVASKL